MDCQKQKNYCQKAFWQSFCGVKGLGEGNVYIIWLSATLKGIADLTKCSHLLITVRGITDGYCLSRLSLAFGARALVVFSVYWFTLAVAVAMMSRLLEPMLNDQNAMEAVCKYCYQHGYGFYKFRCLWQAYEQLDPEHPDFRPLYDAQPAGRAESGATAQEDGVMEAEKMNGRETWRTYSTASREEAI